jgi:glycosyltransferase involved in cell wall biosynthesis
MLTVLFATRNRARILQSVLRTFCRVESPDGGWKLVVVDNGSSDQTALVLASYSDRLPLYSVVEPQLGKNCALNAGLALVEGDLTVLTDDDVFPRADWLVEFRRAADDHTEYSIFGGAIQPRWEVAPPPWVEWITDPGPVYSITDPSMKDGPVEGFLVFGPNMAIRSSVFQSGMRFNSEIGPRGASYPMGSETEFILRIERQGHKAWHVQRAIVEHFVREEQLKESWVLERAVRWGRGRFRMSRNVKLWMGIPRHLFRDIPKEAILVAAARACFRRRALFQSHWRLNVLLGMASESRSMIREWKQESNLMSRPHDSPRGL